MHFLPLGPFRYYFSLLDHNVHCIFTWLSWFICVRVHVCFQVISIDLRSTQFDGGLGVILPAQADGRSKPKATELPYAKMLNRVLPQDIRVLDWSAVETGFSARFDCQSRTYRYYFPHGSLDVELMGGAAKR